MASAYYRALATCSVLKDQLESEKIAREAMELCFKKIYRSLELYKGHLINRIRFHMDRHHSEYIRRVRVQKHQREKKRKPVPVPPTRQSERTTAHSKEIDQLKATLLERETHIDKLASALDAQHPVETADKEVQSEDIVDLFLL